MVAWSIWTILTVAAATTFLGVSCFWGIAAAAGCDALVCCPFNLLCCPPWGKKANKPKRSRRDDDNDNNDVRVTINLRRKRKRAKYNNVSDGEESDDEESPRFAAEQVRGTKKVVTPQRTLPLLPMRLTFHSRVYAAR